MSLGIEHADLQGEAPPRGDRATAGSATSLDHVDLNGRPRFTTAARR
ncbi:MAG: hypothetical protein WKF47_13850 [Geodermatophilaceae bacterium]